jgi:hypothetical protein
MSSTNGKSSEPSFDPPGQSLQNGSSRSERLDLEQSMRDSGSDTESLLAELRRLREVNKALKAALRYVEENDMSHLDMNSDVQGDASTSAVEQSSKRKRSPHPEDAIPSKKIFRAA